jgi:hypothetical protein
MKQYYVCDLNGGKLIRGCDSILGYRTYADSGFNAIVAYSRDCGQRKSMASYIVSGSRFSGGRVKLFGDMLIVSNKDGIETVFPDCKVTQSELPF